MKLTTLLALIGVAAVRGAVYEFDEVDFDFVDNDIGNVQAPDVHACFRLCTDPSSVFSRNCAAVSFYQGVCYFKSKRGDIILKPGVTSTGVYQWPQQPCRNILQNKDFVDNDIGSAKAPVGDCCALCQKKQGCRAFSWNNFEGGTCWFKSKRGLVVDKPGVQSGVVYPDGGGNPLNVEYDTDYTDHDIGNKPSGDAQGCFDLCNNFPGCHAFSWSNLNGGTCWLKSMKGTPIAKPGVISAVVSGNLPTCPLVGDNKDIVDHDIASKSGIPNPDDCCVLCAAQPGCTSFSWNNYMGGTCWFKNQLIFSVGPSGLTDKWGVKSYGYNRGP